MTTLRIDTKTGRAKLPARADPFWRKLSRFKYIGLRKTESGNESWVARFTENRRHRHRALGDLTEAFDFDQAVAAAQAWFDDVERGVTGRTLSGEEATVEAACRAYVDDRRKHKGDACALDAQRRFERTVYGALRKDGKVKHRPHALASMRLDKIRSRALTDWRDGLVAGGLSKAAVNRTLVTLKATLNLAVRDRLVTADRAIEWGTVLPFKNASQRRDLFLDLKQRRALLGACNGALRDLVEAVMLTGCRAGELTRALRSQFDARTKTLNVTGKTGSRAIPLSPGAVALFTRLAKSKLPTAHLLTRDDGKPWAHSDWDELVREAAAKAELPVGVCLYTLRHSFITEALLGGMSTLEVSKMTGTSLVMVDKFYGHLAQTTARAKLARLNLT
jgi:integrase